MKKIILSMLFVISLFGDDFDWVYDFNEAKELAKEEEKIVMMFLSMEFCPVCKYTKEKIFTNEEIAELLEDNMIFYYVDVVKDKVPEGFSYKGTPTTYFLRPDGFVIGKKFQGAAPVEEYKKIIFDYLRIK